MKKQENVNRKANEAREYFAGTIQLDGRETRVLFTPHELKRPVARAEKQPEDFPKGGRLGILSLLKRLLPLVMLATITLICAGCSHNILTYSDGIGLETTMRPDSGNFGFMFRYGKILNLTARENTAMEMGGAGGADAGEAGDNASASSEANVRIRIGAQTTGYDRDIITALKDHPEAIKAFYEAKNSAKEKRQQPATEPASDTAAATESQTETPEPASDTAADAEGETATPEPPPDENAE